VESLGPRLRELREARGLSQRELADLAGIDVMQVNRYERGMHLPSLETTVKLARLFEVPTDELLGTSSARSKPAEIRNIKLQQRFRILDKLPRADQDVVLQLVDAVIARRRLSSVLEGPDEE